MKKVGIITFHGSHNYGSSLQAYALQSTICKLGFDCEIINFRSSRQRDLYNVFTRRKGVKYIFKNSSHLFYYKGLKAKHDKFEQFIENNLWLGNKLYTSLDELMNNPPEYDYYISGSDQIWNPIPADFDWAYYLPFIKRGKRISYAPSFGPIANMVNYERIIKDKICAYIKQYDNISVREEEAKKIVDELVGCDAEIVIDPTLLITKNEWDEISGINPLIDGEYMLFYTLFADKEMIRIIKRVSEYLELPVVVTNFSNQYDIFSPFKKQLASGPLEFLNLIKNAKFVCTSSFHGTVFSILFNRPFYAIRGLKDKRIYTLLKLTGLSDRAITIKELNKKISMAYNMELEHLNECLKTMRDRSMVFLHKSLEVE